MHEHCMHGLTRVLNSLDCWLRTSGQLSHLSKSTVRDLVLILKNIHCLCYMWHIAQLCMHVYPFNVWHMHCGLSVLDLYSVIYLVLHDLYIYHNKARSFDYSQSLCAHSQLLEELWPQRSYCWKKALGKPIIVYSFKQSIKTKWVCFYIIPFVFLAL